MPKMKKLISILAAVVLGALLIGNCQKQRTIDRLTEQTATLPTSQMAAVSVAENKVVSKVRQTDGSVKAKVQYVPPEGKVEITQPVEGVAQVKVKRAGFTFRPAVQGLAGDGLKIGLGARLVYFNRYGAGFGITHEIEPYLFADRRIDDMVGLFKNTTIGVFGGPHAAGVLVSVYF